MSRDIWIDIGGGDGDFYAKQPHSLFDFLGGKQLIVLDPRAKNRDKAGVHFQSGGINPGEQLPFPDGSIARLDANFIIGDMRLRFAALLTEAVRVLRSNGVIHLCDYQESVSQLAVWARDLPEVGVFNISKPRQVELGERSLQADQFLIRTGAVSLDEAANYINATNNVFLSGELIQATMRGELAPEVIQKYQRYVPHILSFQKS